MIRIRARAVLASAALASAAAFLAVPARAATYTIGELTAGSLQLFPKTVAGGLFTDEHFFSLGGGDLGLNQAVQGNTILNLYAIDGLNLTLYRQAADLSWTPVIGGPADVNLMVIPGALPGQFRVDIGGQAVGSNGGFYTLGLQAFVVPVPAAAVLFVSGLAGLAGVIVRARTRRA